MRIVPILPRTKQMTYWMRPFACRPLLCLSQESPPLPQVSRQLLRDFATILERQLQIDYKVNGLYVQGIPGSRVIIDPKMYNRYISKATMFKP